MQNSFTWSVIRDTAAFDDCKDEWMDLLERSNARVFQSFEWQRTWWQCFGETNNRCELFLVTIRRSDRLVAIAPLYVERLSFGAFLLVRCLRFIGQEVSDYLDIVCEAGLEVQVHDVLLDALQTSKKEFDLIKLEDIPDGSPFHALLAEGLPSAGFTGAYFQNAQCPRTVLKETWEATLESFSKKHKKDIAYELRNVLRNFSVELDVTVSREMVQTDIEEFVAMHQERWTLAGHPGVFRDTEQAHFHRRVALLCFERGWLFLAFLKLNGRRVAVNYGFRFRDTLSTYLNGMVELGDMSKYSPGKVLHEFSMQLGISEGRRVYDFMRGKERYKYALGAADVPNWTVLMYKDGSQAARIKFRIHLLIASLKRRVQKEATMFRHVANIHGWLSLSMVRHIGARLRQNTLDTLQKVKEPEKSLE